MKLQMQAPAMTAWHGGHDPTPCRPCSRFFAGACAEGQACAFCHLHSRNKKARLSKNKRERMHKIVNYFESLIAADPWSVDLSNIPLPPAFVRHPDVATDLRARLIRAREVAVQAQISSLGGVGAEARAAGPSSTMTPAERLWSL
mmetsp:Transcript_92378/g.265734  ORF Transcript_92378/g.265734 Transcript_92378/m.265734 type:complete len:145 (+) Transcript_92378:397-831(+)